jgi:tetratricopeptide (TPR) repeat protein
VDRRRTKQKRAFQQQRLAAKSRPANAAHAVSSTPPAIKQPPWFSNPQLDCPCGSGGHFADCCGKYLTSPTVGAPIPDISAIGQLAWCRARLTQYIGYVFAHTLPHVVPKASNPAAQQIIAVDIDALDELVSNLVKALQLAGRASETVATINRIDRLVPLPGLSARLLAMKVLILDSVVDDPASAQEMLQGVDFRQVNDRMLLRAILAVDKQTPLTSRIELIDRILERAKSADETAHYTCAKATAYLLMGDRDNATKLVEAATSVNVVPKNANGLGPWECTVYARALALRWRLTNDSEALAAARKWFEAIPTDDLNPAGLAEIDWQVGDLLADAGDHKEAVPYLRQSIAHFPFDAARIRLADAEAALGNTEQARYSLASVKYSELSEGVKLEFLQARANIAVVEHDSNGIAEVVASLRALDLGLPYYSDARNRTCVDLLLLSQSWQSESREVTAGKLKRAWMGIKWFTEYLELKPNLFGLGLNINRVFSDRDKP